MRLPALLLGSAIAAASCGQDTSATCNGTSARVESGLRSIHTRTLSDMQAVLGHAYMTLPSDTELIDLVGYGPEAPQNPPITRHGLAAEEWGEDREVGGLIKNDRGQLLQCQSKGPRNVACYLGEIDSKKNVVPSIVRLTYVQSDASNSKLNKLTFDESFPGNHLSDAVWADSDGTPCRVSILDSGQQINGEPCDADACGNVADDVHKGLRDLFHTLNK